MHITGYDSPCIEQPIFENSIFSGSGCFIKPDSSWVVLWKNNIQKIKNGNKYNKPCILWK